MINSIYILIGTRPNFIKVTQFKKVASLKFPNLKITIIHTGQHYDEKMADVFFRQFNLIPDYFLNIVPASPNKLADSKGNILPDCFLLPEGSTALDFAFSLHTDIGKNFVKAIDAKTGKAVGKDHVLKHRDALEIAVR